MPAYRLCLLDGEGRVLANHHIHGVSSDDAVLQARKLCGSGGFEVWQGTERIYAETAADGFRASGRADEP